VTDDDAASRSGIGRSRWHRWLDCTATDLLSPERPRRPPFPFEWPRDSVCEARVPIDVLAIQLGTNRNAIYKNLFDASYSLRARMAAAGHPVLETDAA
jgi:hypothetical protein